MPKKKKLAKYTLDGRKIPAVDQESAEYYKHLENLRNAKTQIDNQAPLYMKDHFLRMGKMATDLSRVLNLANENKIIVKRLKDIKCTVDHWNPNATIYESKLKSTHERLRDITRDNIKLRQRILDKECTEDLKLEVLNCWWQDVMRIIQTNSKYPLHFKAANVKEPTNEPYPECRPRCYMDFGLECGVNFGRVIFELYADICPKTSNNFLGICSGRNDKGYTYTQSMIHRVLPGLFIQGGDIIKYTGRGGASIYGDSFEEENFELPLDRAGTLAMVTMDGAVNSQFIVTVRPLPLLNGKRVVFGRVVSGMKVIRKLDGAGNKSTGHTVEPILVLDSGQVLAPSRYVSAELYISEWKRANRRAKKKTKQEETAQKKEEDEENQESEEAENED